jgi:hypothetical protein
MLIAALGMLAGPLGNRTVAVAVSGSRSRHEAATACPNQCWTGDAKSVGIGAGATNQGAEQRKAMHPEVAGCTRTAGVVSR